MRRRPSICDACSRFRQRSHPEAITTIDRYIPYCDAFPERIPEEIYIGGFDHRDEYPGDGGVRFNLREGAERSLVAYEQRLSTTQNE